MRETGVSERWKKYSPSGHDDVGSDGGASRNSERKKKEGVGGDIFSFQLSKGQSRPHTNTRKKERKKKKKRKGTNRNSPNIRGKSHFLHGNKRLKSGIRLSPKFEINVPRSNLFFQRSDIISLLMKLGNARVSSLNCANWDSEMWYHHHHHRRCQPLCPRIYLPINIPSVTLPSVSRSQK